MDIKSPFLGDEESSLRVVRIAVIATIVASLPIILQVDTILHSLRWYLWDGLIVFALGLAGYAGRNNGGLLSGWLAVSLAVLWLYVVPPLVAYLQGASFGERNYHVLRPSVVGMDPYSELMYGLKYGPILALLVALIAGTTAFVLGKGSHRLFPPNSGA